MPEWKVKLKLGKKQWEAGLFGPQITEDEVKAHLLATIEGVEVLSIDRADVPIAPVKEVKK